MFLCNNSMFLKNFLNKFYYQQFNLNFLKNNKLIHFLKYFFIHKNNSYNFTLKIINNF